MAEQEEARREAEDVEDSAGEVALAGMEVDMGVLEEDLEADSEVEAVDMLLTKSASQQFSNSATWGPKIDNWVGGRNLG